MPTESGGEHPLAEVIPTPKPYVPSWVDRLIAWIERLPGPAWWSYVAMILLEIMANHGLRWLDGSLSPGSFSLTGVASAPITICTIALLHYLNATARTALSAFRPALEATESDMVRFQYELTTAPARGSLVVTVVGAVTGILSVLGDPERWGIFTTTSLATNVYTFAYASFSIATAFVFLYHTVRQLRLVSFIHRFITRIDFSQPAPLYAFSALTTRTGIGIVLLVAYTYYFMNYLNAERTTPGLTLVDFSVFAIALGVAVGAFVLPLYGMHQRLAQEKTRLIAEANSRLKAVINELHGRVDAGDFDRMGDLKNALEGFAIELGMLGKISTWPWSPETPRGFLGVVIMPILLWLTTALLGRLLNF